MQEKRYKCEICGESATIMVRDTEPDFEMKKKRGIYHDKG